MIVPAALEHLEDIAQIEKSVFNKPWTKNQLQHDIQTQLETENYVYLLGEKVIGYIFGWIIQDEYHLNNIAVHPEHQRKNIAKALIQYVINKLLPKKVQIILLEVSAKNIGARKCYESLGFIQNGSRKDYYASGEDAFLFQMEIGTYG